MIIALTGTPGTGKTSASKILEENNFEVVDLNKLAIEKGFLIGDDKYRNSKIVDIERLNNHVRANYGERNIIFIEGHLSHLLKSVDKVIVLRCHPDELRKRLSRKRWKKEKVRENIEAEILDIVLCEAVDIRPEKNIFEIDTTGESTKDVARSVMEITKNGFRHMKRYNIGNIDWSEEILKDFK